MTVQHLSNNQILTLIGSRFEAARLNEGLDQKKLAELSGVSVGTIQNIESGKASVGLAKVIAILRALNMVDLMEVFIPAIPQQSIALTTTKNTPRKRVATKSSQSTSSKNFAWKNEVSIVLNTDKVNIKDGK